MRRGGAWSPVTVGAVGVLAVLVFGVLVHLGNAGERGGRAGAATLEPPASPQPSGWFEVTAMKVRPGEKGLDRAWFRITDVEGTPVDDATWAGMQELATDAVGGVPDEVEASRRADSVKATSGQTLVDVVFHGRAIHVYYTPGTADGWFRDFRAFLDDRGFVLAQGDLRGGPSEWIEIPADWEPADIAAYQSS